MPNYNTYPKYYTSHQSSLAWRMIEDNNKRTIECNFHHEEHEELEGKEKKEKIFLQQVSDQQEEIPLVPK